MNKHLTDSHLSPLFHAHFSKDHPQVILSTHQQKV